MATSLTPRVLWVLVPLVAHSMVGCAKMSSQSTLIEYHRSGGITGREEQLVVQGDGAVRLSRRGVVSDFQVGADTLAQLRSQLQGIDFASLRAEYLPARPGADLFEYILVYQGDRVRTMDTAIPPELQPLINLLNGILSRRP